MLELVGRQAGGTTILQLLSLTHSPLCVLLVCACRAKAKPVAMTQVLPTQDPSLGPSPPLPPGGGVSPVSWACFGPMDSTACLAYGKDGVFRFFRLLPDGAELRPLPPPRMPAGVSRSLTSHCWLKAPQDHLVMVRPTHPPPTTGHA